MRTTTIGSGYVGLASRACFADFGHDVICIDKDQRKNDALHEGRMPIFEPGPHDGPYQAMEGADAVAILTEWDAYRALDFERVKSLPSQPVLVDLRNVYGPAEAKASGFSYTGIGR